MSAPDAGATVGADVIRTAARDGAASFRSIARLRTAAVVALLAAFLVAVALVALDGVRGIRELEDRRDNALGSQPDVAAIAGEVAGALRRFRSELREGERFALEFSPDVGRDQEGFYRLVALSFLYPAVAVADPEHAHGLMAFGGPPAPDVRGAFREIAVVDGVWLGRRPG